MSTNAWWKKLGPGLITGAADDDPSGIATYSQGGAQYGYDVAWTVLVTYPLTVGIQLASAQIGRITGKGLTVPGGIYDLNSEFDRVQAEGMFLNSSFGVTSEFAESGATGPSIYPRTAAALRFAFRPWNGALLRTASVNGASLERPDGSHALLKRGDGTLQVLEGSLLRRSDATDDEPWAPRIFGRFAPLPTYEDEVAIGVWHYSKHFAEAGAADENDASSESPHHVSEGAYAIGEWRIFGRGSDAKKRISGFAQFGFGSPATNRFGSYGGAGLVATGWIGKDADQIGIAVASAQEGSAYRRNASLAGIWTTKAETTWELSHLHQLKSWLTLAPEVQFVSHPNADAAQHGALVIQLLSEIAI